MSFKFIARPKTSSVALIAGVVIASAAASTLSVAADDSAVVAAAQKNIDKFIAGTETKPPASGPKAVAGKSIYVISCGQVIPGCSMQTNGAPSSFDQTPSSSNPSQETSIAGPRSAP